MADLVSFAKVVKERLERANREPHWTASEADQYMADVAIRRKQFLELAARLRSTIIQPRLELVANYISNASAGQNDPEGQCSYWFGFCERFPATTKVSFAVEHDVRFEQVIVAYDASMVPIFIKFNEHDKLIGRPEELTDDAVAAWVEKRLAEFLDAYLQIDRGNEDFIDEPATDPVCGMRINRSTAAGSASYHGHPYFFCSEHCLANFNDNPAEFVKVKTM